jgi:hypothetical protein
MSIADVSLTKFAPETMLDLAIGVGGITLSVESFAKGEEDERNGVKL